MCYNRIECDSFTESPFNSSVCLIYCSRNPDVIEQDNAYDWFNPTKGEKTIRKPITRRQEEDDRQETRVEEDFGEVDKFIDMMNKQKTVPSSTDLRESEAKAIKGAEGEMIQKPEPPKRPYKTLDPSDIILNLQKKLNKSEEKIVKESEVIHDEQHIKDKIDEIQKELNVSKEKGLDKCPHCGKEFKRLDAHIRWCKSKPAGEK